MIKLTSCSEVLAKMNFLKVAQLFQLCCVFGYLQVLDSMVKQRRCLCHKRQFLVSKTCLQCKKNLKSLLSFRCLSAIIISICSWNYKGCGGGGGEGEFIMSECVRERTDQKVKCALTKADPRQAVSVQGSVKWLYSLTSQWSQNHSVAFVALCFATRDQKYE